MSVVVESQATVTRRLNATSRSPGEDQAAEPAR
ncbi:MAG: hypothetical protein QOF73_4903 [Thermomicrobiales bacterium]|nr:hypothetical protein [Thermomicrobiales bacterium]